MSRVCRVRFVECKQKANSVEWHISICKIRRLLFLFHSTSQCPVSHSVYFWSSAKSNSPFSHLHSSEHGLVSNRFVLFCFFICNKPEVLFRVKTLRLPCVKKTADSGHQGISHAYCIFYYCVYIDDHIPWYIFRAYFFMYLPRDIRFYLHLWYLCT